MRLTAEYKVYGELHDKKKMEQKSMLLFYLRSLMNLIQLEPFF